MAGDTRYVVEVTVPDTGVTRRWLSRSLSEADAVLVFQFVRRHFPAWQPSLRYTSGRKVKAVTV